MPSKNIDKDADKKGKSKSPKTLSCGPKGPGPKYELKPVTGFKNHCQSKYRNPAFTIGRLLKDKIICKSPGPIYLYKLPGAPGFTIPHVVHSKIKDCSPGPKYSLPDFKSPAFSIISKPKDKCVRSLPGPYGAPPIPPGPAFTIGSRGKDRKCDINPPIRDIGRLTLMKPSSPMFSIARKPELKEKCRSPGPKYLPLMLKKSPAFMFGSKHNECLILPRAECDEMC